MRRAALSLVILSGIALLCWWVWRGQRREHRFDGQIKLTAQQLGLDPALIKAVIWKESRFDPGARGTKEEFGLMQLQEVTAQEWADHYKITNFVHDHAFHPGTNIMAGSWYLAKLLRRYKNQDDPIPYALADYNAGRTHVLRWRKGAALTNSAAFISQIDYPGTRAYIAAVTKRRRHYEREFGSWRK